MSLQCKLCAFYGLYRGSAHDVTDVRPSSYTRWVVERRVAAFSLNGPAWSNYIQKLPFVCPRSLWMRRVKWVTCLWRSSMWTVGTSWRGWTLLKLGSWRPGWRWTPGERHDRGRVTCWYVGGRGGGFMGHASSVALGMQCWCPAVGPVFHLRVQMSLSAAEKVLIDKERYYICKSPQLLKKWCTTTQTKEGKCLH